MSEVIYGSYDTKQIHELTSMAKITGREELLIDDGEQSYRVTVDTLLGYIRNTINGNGGGSSSAGGGTTIHMINIGDPNIPVESRPEGHYYIRVVNTVEAQLNSGLPRLIKVSPNMQLRMVD